MTVVIADPRLNDHNIPNFLLVAPGAERMLWGRVATYLIPSTTGRTVYARPQVVTVAMPGATLGGCPRTDIAEYEDIESARLEGEMLQGMDGE